ncbi:alpha/beta fold hydrolase [Deinococcus yavapaiensis]|uniref:Pimeloyl-ACP methyl ester carboxylesterase n=1 Tax=Deinococcus yavapaiensis KR-236 TaxID=694435 RepID=A0A318SGN7_9DEIO|nr:alpha/beta fold hydrolase [Deinococcus yavapaiensis]PYE53151.1 pimeloyl-ACP methyl ester carboxylesterase [Deinococcus yavapaiensis KR-236]
MSSFVLVHGAWGGGWYWRDVARRLQSAGHDVVTPTLTGLGERSHLGGPDIDLDTHVRDIVQALEYEDLRDVLLVGHSLGGMVVTGVSNEVPHRLGHLVFLDADLPRHGQSRFDLQPEAREWWEERAREGDGWRVTLDLPDEALADIISDPGVRAWYVARSHGQGQPIGVLRQAVRLTNDAAKALPRTFIACTIDAFGMRSGLYGRMARVAASDGNTRLVEVPASHFAPVSHPNLIANALMEVARGTA